MSIHSGNQILKRLAFETSGTLDETNAKVILPVTNVTGAHTCTLAESGTFFFTLGATAPTFTLPTVPTKGCNYWFINGTTETMTVTGAANVVVAYKDATATSVAATDIGVIMFAIADGNSWHILSFGNADQAAATIAVT